MEDKEAGVQYNRWNDDNINLDVAASQSRMMRVYDRLCTGNTGIAVKVAVAVAVLIIIYVIGYVTGYYVHKC
ncbi:small integral membrane protein 1 [Megalops cyprinoides]|uniref:small integral membrane protein 1 n=1 Tax=Megalops cyprinoides TaxID=118141 RepID=UPI001863B53E|nr:small integral membrane protein 1 [Megalops cyprinoides]